MIENAQTEEMFSHIPTSTAQAQTEAVTAGDQASVLGQLIPMVPTTAVCLSKTLYLCKLRRGWVSAPETVH